jgi:hypothetical protein
MALARAANAITLARTPLMVPLRNASPATLREHFAGLLYVSAVLYEALRTAQNSEPLFSDLKEWEEGFGNLLADPDVAEFRDRKLKRFRNKGMFHFDAKFFGDGASRWPDEEILLATMTSNLIGDIYINASDDLLFTDILGPFDTDEALGDAFLGFGGQIVDVMDRFLQSAHLLIPPVFKAIGAEARAV